MEQSPGSTPGSVVPNFSVLELFATEDYEGNGAGPFTLVCGRTARGSGAKLKQERLRLVARKSGSGAGCPRSLCHLPPWKFSRPNKVLSNQV